jgi:hypothetical protein
MEIFEIEKEVYRASFFIIIRVLKEKMRDNFYV